MLKCASIPRRASIGEDGRSPRWYREGIAVVALRAEEGVSDHGIGKQRGEPDRPSYDGAARGLRHRRRISLRGESQGISVAAIASATRVTSPLGRPWFSGSERPR